MNSIYEYIFNDVKEIFTGKINTSKENSNYYDIIDSPSCKVKDSNLIMIPKLIINKNNKRDHFNELIDVAYNKLKIKKNYNNKNSNNNELDNSFYHEIFYFYKNNKTNNLATKIYTIFPNVNFEFTQIKNLSFSNTNLNKYLINSKFKLPEMENNNEFNKNEYNSGFFTMSQNHRLIALKDDIKECGDISKSQSLKEIIFGIWINLKDEKPSPKKADLDFLFNKNKLLIFKECFRFIQLSNNIETIYSPSPEENIFLLVIFYKGMQCHYEVKLILNNDEKNIYIKNNNNCWLISKCKYDLNEQRLTIPFDFDIKIEINNGTILTMAEYLNKKTKNNNSINNLKEKNKDEIQDNQNLKNSYKNVNIANENNNENLKIKEIKNENNNINNNLLNNTSSDLFNLSDYDEDIIYGGYNYPLAMQNINNINKNFSNNNNSKNNQNKNEQNIIYKNKQHEISRASTNAPSNKPSLSSSKNSGKNNNSNLENINHNNEEENNINDNSFELINQYTSIIMKNSESIKKLQNQVSNLEKNILEIINQLENEEREENKNIKIKKDKKKKEKKKVKEKKEVKEIKEIKHINDINNDTDIQKSNIQDISNFGDISINVPRIIYKELSITKDDL